MRSLILLLCVLAFFVGYIGASKVGSKLPSEHTASANATPLTILSMGKSCDQEEVQDCEVMPRRPQASFMRKVIGFSLLLGFIQFIHERVNDGKPPIALERASDIPKVAWSYLRAIIWFLFWVFDPRDRFQSQ